MANHHTKCSYQTVKKPRSIKHQLIHRLLRFGKLSVLQIETKMFAPTMQRQELDLTFVSNQNGVVVVPAPVQLNPISVKGDRVTFDTKSMVTDQWYEFQKKGEKYLAVMKNAGVIDIYRIRE